jgi:DUF2934 family protein
VSDGEPPLVTISRHNPLTVPIYNVKQVKSMNCGVSAVDSATRTRERQKLMLELLERKIRLRARQLYQERGQVEGQELEDWVRAESEILKTSILAPLWNRRQEREPAEVEA